MNSKGSKMRKIIAQEKKVDSCSNCFIPRSCYDLKHEPSFGYPDYTMPTSCIYGHRWIKGGLNGFNE